MICPRCELEFIKLDKHTAVCEQIPTPAELAERFHTDPGVTILTFRQEYNGDFQFIKERLIAGGVSKKELRQRARLVKSNNNRRASRQQYLRGKTVCRGCEILLDHPLVPDSGNGFCEWCISEGVPERMKRQRMAA